MKAKVLAYHMVDEARKEALRQAMTTLEIEVHFVCPEAYGRTLEEVLAIKEEAMPATLPAGRDIDDEMLVFVGIPGDKLSDVLAALRGRQLRVQRKAMLTKSNQAWNGFQLFGELTQEAAMIKQVRTAKLS